MQAANLSTQWHEKQVAVALQKLRQQPIWRVKRKVRVTIKQLILPCSTLATMSGKIIMLVIATPQHHFHHFYSPPQCEAQSSAQNLAPNHSEALHTSSKHDMHRAPHCGLDYSPKAISWTINPTKK